MKILSILLLICTSGIVQAQVFKCTDKLGKINYQAVPCQTLENGKQLQIKGNPGKEAEGKVKMQALQAEYDGKKAKQAQLENQAVLAITPGMQQQIIYQQNSNPGIIMPSAAGAGSR